MGTAIGDERCGASTNGSTLLYHGRCPSCALWGWALRVQALRARERRRLRQVLGRRPERAPPRLPSLRPPWQFSEPLVNFPHVLS